MRGQVDPQSQMFSYFSPESRVPADHPLRSIKVHTDRVLKELSGELDALYSETGRPSIPPERLLKGQLLIDLDSVRSDRMFCQMLDYNILFRWFLDMSLEESGLDQSNFTRLRERLVNEDLAQRFFDAIVRIARKEALLSSEHLTVDGTLIEAWAGQKIFKPKDGPPLPPDGRGGVDVRGTKRTNDTNASTSDPEAKSARKGKGKEAKLCFGGDALMENRKGLCVDIRVSSALETESAAAVELLKRQARKRLKPASLGGDKGYHNTAFVDFLRRRGIRPHIAQIEGRDTVGLDRRTTRHESYWVSQRKRKRSSAG
jgi:transposase